MFVFLFHELIKAFWFSPWSKHHRHKQTRSESAKADIPEGIYLLKHFFSHGMFDKWKAKEKLFHVVLSRYRTNTISCSSFPKSVVSSNSKIKFPLRFVAATVYCRISTESSWMRHLMVLFDKKNTQLTY